MPANTDLGRDAFEAAVDASGTPCQPPLQGGVHAEGLSRTRIWARL